MQVHCQERQSNGQRFDYGRAAIPHKIIHHVLWDHRCSWLWDFRNRYGWRCFSCRDAFMRLHWGKHRQQPTMPLRKGHGPWQTFPCRDRWKPGHLSLLMQGFLCIWEFMMVCLCLYQLCDSGHSKWIQQKITAPKSGIAQSASWVQIALGEESTAGKKNSFNVGASYSQDILQGAQHCPI